ncbi:MAG: hypothetical protein AB8I52_12730 [Candidatus Promineifilaceae bacterium]
MLSRFCGVDVVAVSPRRLLLLADSLLAALLAVGRADRAGLDAALVRRGGHWWVFVSGL